MGKKRKKKITRIGDKVPKTNVASVYFQIIHDAGEFSPRFQFQRFEFVWYGTTSDVQKILAVKIENIGRYRRFFHFPAIIFWPDVFGSNFAYIQTPNVADSFCGYFVPFKRKKKG